VKTDGLITSELILIGDYRTLGLWNPRIIDTLPFCHCQCRACHSQRGRAPLHYGKATYFMSRWFL